MNGVVKAAMRDSKQLSRNNCEAIKLPAQGPARTIRRSSAICRKCLCVLKLLARSASAAAAQIDLHSACLAVAWRRAALIVEALMRFSFLIAALVASTPISLYASPASAD